MAYEIALVLVWVGIAGVLAYLAVAFDKRYTPIKIMFLFGALLALIFSLASGVQLIKLQDKSFTVNCDDTNSSTACTAYDNLNVLQVSSYETVLWVSIAALLLYFVYFIWDVLSMAVENKQRKKREREA